MKPNNINKIFSEHYKSVKPLEKKSMKRLEDIYDDFMYNVVNCIKFYDVDTLSKTLMTMINFGKLEQVSGNFYKYKDFHILELLKRDGVDYSQKIKTLDKLNLSITQRYIETIDKDGSIYIITQIPGTENGNLTPLWKFGSQNVAKEDKIAAFHDLQKLTKAGLTDDRISNSNELWFVNSDKKIVIPNFEYLRPIRSDESQKGIMERYYNILFK